MNSIDLTPLYRSSIGFDRLASLLNSAATTDAVSSGYPPYNIEMLDDNRYSIELAVAGFSESELDINVEKGVLTVRGKKNTDKEHRYLHQGIAHRAFERNFNLADYVEVVDATLSDGLLTISLVKEVPEAMKPRAIPINSGEKAIENKQEEQAEANDSKAA